MAAATVVAVYTSVQGDGGNSGNGVTTDSTPATDDYLVVGFCGSANADAMTKPDVTWTEFSVPDNSIATGGGAIRAYWKKNPAASTTYTWTLSSGRRSVIGLLVRGADGTTFFDAASSLQSVPGANHTPPSVTTLGIERLIIDFAGLRQFSPDVADWAVPASGLTWTQLADIQGADGNNNIRLAAGAAVAASAGAVSTAVWTQTDTAEESIIIRIAVIPAAAGGGTVTWLPQQVRRGRGALLRTRVRVAQPPLVAQQPLPAAAVVQVRRRPFRARRAKVSSPPWPVIAPTPPVWVPQLRRSRPELPLIRREGRSWQPPWIGAALAAVPPSWVPQPRRDRPPLATVRRDRGASPSPTAVQLVPAPRRDRPLPPFRIRHPFRIVLPATAPAVPPPIVLQPPKRRPRFLGVRRGRSFAPFLEGAEATECLAARPDTGTVTRAATVSVARPDTGTALRGATGAVTRPYTGIVEQCSCCT